ncbi:hypothetical protein B0H10DRAFT_1771634, partial [Mycena sp. CBHHK59/15]
YNRERKLQPAVVHAVSLGRTTLQRYYMKTSLSDVYSLATSELITLVVLHPSSKLKYFCANSFDSEWITACESKLRAKYDEYRKCLAPNEPEIQEVNILILFFIGSSHILTV